MAEKKYIEDPKKRFSPRVGNYVKYRPSYPNDIITFLTEKDILTENTVIADIGSGTGILTKIFLKNGNQVYGIEPNENMRKAGERILNMYPNFVSLEGSAESTGLVDESIDLIIAGQSFHWFDVEKAHKEFKRILKENGYVALIWNNRRKVGSDLLRDYEDFISKFGTDYKLVRKNEGNVNLFFKYRKSTFYNYQDLNFTGLKGRLLSVSYIPLDNNPIYPNMIKELEELFDKHQRDGIIRLDYDTEIYLGKLE